jgi:hypothetical protein
VSDYYCAICQGEHEGLFSELVHIFVACSVPVVAMIVIWIVLAAAL